MCESYKQFQCCWRLDLIENHELGRNAIQALSKASTIRMESCALFQSFKGLDNKEVNERESSQTREAPLEKEIGTDEGRGRTKKAEE